RVPIVNRSSPSGVSTFTSRWVTTTISLPSVASAFSTAATDAGRPTESGISSPGNSTEFFNGNNGSELIWISCFSAMSLSLSLLRCFGPHCGLYFERKPFSTLRYQHFISIANLSADDLPRQRRLHFSLDRPLQRPGPERRVITDLHQMLA